MKALKLFLPFLVGVFSFQSVLFIHAGQSKPGSPEPGGKVVSSSSSNSNEAVSLKMPMELFVPNPQREGITKNMLSWLTVDEDGNMYRPDARTLAKRKPIVELLDVPEFDPTYFTRFGWLGPTLYRDWQALRMALFGGAGGEWSNLATYSTCVSKLADAAGGPNRLFHFESTLLKNQYCRDRFKTNDYCRTRFSNDDFVTFMKVAANDNPFGLEGKYGFSAVSTLRILSALHRIVSELAKCEDGWVTKAFSERNYPLSDVEQSLKASRSKSICRVMRLFTDEKGQLLKREDLLKVFPNQLDKTESETFNSWDHPSKVRGPGPTCFAAYEFGPVLRALGTFADSYYFFRKFGGAGRNFDLTTAIALKDAIERTDKRLKAQDFYTGFIERLSGSTAEYFSPGINEAMELIKSRLGRLMKCLTVLDAYILKNTPRDEIEVLNEYVPLLKLSNDKDRAEREKNIHPVEDIAQIISEDALMIQSYLQYYVIPVRCKPVDEIAAIPIVGDGLLWSLREVLLMVLGVS